MNAEEPEEEREGVRGGDEALVLQQDERLHHGLAELAVQLRMQLVQKRHELLR